MRRGICRALAVLFVALGSVSSGAAAEAAPARTLWTHDIDLSLDPAKHSLSSTDRIVAGGTGGPLRFSLHAGLRIGGFSIDGKDARALLKPDAPRGGQTGSSHPAPGHLAFYEGPELRAGARLLISYQGEIHDPVSQEKGLGFVAGDSTSGFIGSEGVFLDGGTGWAPIFQPPDGGESPGGALAMFNVTARVPEPWLVVTQGRREPVKSAKGLSVARYVAEVASDGLALVAGRYRVKSIVSNGVTISTYFFAEESEQSDIFLEKTSAYLDKFARLLARYPYSRFDVVENFFTTGYGFPSFTLLGQDVVRMGEMALRPGYVDHEVMHCWWGNYVYPDLETGNWAEGLTTYFANYMAQEEAGAAQAADYRRNIAQKYSLRVKPELDYPLSAFKEKKLDFENEIGYGKAAMVFHLLRRLSGDEVFFRTMRDMTVAYGGRRAGWANFRAAFEHSTGRDLGEFFAEWIERPGLPSLALGPARSEPSRSGSGRHQVTGSIEQGDGPIYHLTVPLVIETVRGPREYDVLLTDRLTPFKFETDALPVEVRLDPDMHVPRWLQPAEIPPCLNATLEDRTKTVVLPAASPADDPYLKVAETASGAKGATITHDDALKDGPPAGTSLLLLGSIERNAAARDLLARIQPSFKPGAQGFTVQGESFSGPEYSLLYSARHPDDPNHVVTFFYGMSPEALERSRNLFYYGWDSWVVFKSGRPERRGTFDIGGTRARRTLVQDLASGVAGITAAALMEHASALASPTMEGRRPGTPGHEAAAAYIEKFFAEHGVAAGAAVAPFVEEYRHAFTLPLVDIDMSAGGSAEIQVVRSDGEILYPARPLPIAPSVEPRRRTADPVFLDPEDLASITASPASRRLEGGTVITVERSFPPEADQPTARGRPEIDPRAASLLAAEVNGAAHLGASTLIIARGSDAPSVYEPLLSFPSAPSSADNRTIEAKRKAGEFPGLDLFFSGRSSQVPFAGPAPGPLVLSAGPEIGIDLLGRQAFARHAAIPLTATQPGYKPVLLDLEVGATAPLRVEPRAMANIIGYLEGSDPALKSEAVVVTAHYDAMGRSEDGAMLTGASDNAAGVAAMLEIARWLSDPRQRPARSVLLVATDGEEWGLAGSRALVGRLAEVSLKAVAVVNIDSIGSREVADPFLIGGSYHPEIRAAVDALAASLGMHLGRDIDAYAFDYGSDYFPFHLAGVPAVGFFAANYRALHRSADNLESLDPVALERASRLAAMTVWALAM